MRNDKRQPQQQAPEEDILTQSLRSAQEFLARNWLHLVLGLAIAGAAAIAWQVYSYHRQSQMMAAWGELGSVPGSELQFFVQPQQAAQLRQEAVTVTQDFLHNSPGSTAAPWMMLQLGSLQADSNDWTAAARAFSELTTKYPKSEAAAPGRAALAASLESLGKYKEAGDIYKELAAGGTHPYHLLSAARCRELSGDLPDAEKLYEQVRGLKTEDEELADMAVARLADIALGHRLLPPPLVKPASAATVPSLAPSVPPATPAGAPPAAKPPAAKPAAAKSPASSQQNH